MTHARVLIVDDEESIRLFVARALAADYEVETAADAGQALDIAARHGPFDLCVIDVLMPGMKGDELGRRLRRAHPDIKVLYFTGHSDQLFAAIETLSANETFLYKPVYVDCLLHTLFLLLFDRILP